METRTIKYFKNNKDIIFNDGFEIKEGTKLQFNFAEGQIYNVQIKKGNEKRIFWIHSSEVELYKTIKEKWLKKDIEEHDVDLNDKWFEYEKQQSESKSKNKIRVAGSTVATKTGAKKTKSRQAKAVTTKESDKRTGNKTGISNETRKYSITKRGTKKSKKS